MKVGDYVYFAPGILFKDLDLDGPRLPQQYSSRIEGYYLAPAERAAQAGDAFAAGVLALTAIDAMSKLYFGPNRPSRQVKIDFEFFVRGLLPSFVEPVNARILYEKYRNGLIHEARLKDGCQFELGRSRTFDSTGPTPIIDPASLIAEVRAALKQFVSELRGSSQFLVEIAKCLREEFSFELV
jgi:hypothetical protein